MTLDFDVERVYEVEDFEKIIQIQIKNKDSIYHKWLWSSFKHHEDWLPKALKELVAGEKIAFSAKLRDKEVVHIGSVIIKREAFYDYKVGELKNLVVDEQAIRKEITKEYYPNLSKQSFTPENRKDIELKIKDNVLVIWSKLISKVEGFCKRRGFKKLTFDVAANELTLIDFFLKRNFFISEARMSNYQTGEFLYRLSKDLPTSYSGDPFFLDEMGKWLVKEFFEFEFIEEDYQDFESDTQHEIDEYLQLTCTRRFSFSNKLKTSDKDINDPLHLFTGKIIIIDDFLLDPPFHVISKDICEQLLNQLIGSDLLHFILTYNEHPELRKACFEKGIKYLSRKNDQNLFGRDSSIRAIEFDRSDIAGLTLVVGNDFIDSIKNIDKEFYIFFINGSNGYFIAEPDTEKIILYYAPNIKSQEGGGGIWGYSYFIKHGFSRTASKPHIDFFDLDFFDFFDSDKTKCPKYRKLIKYNEEGPVISLILSKPIKIPPQAKCIPLNSIFGDKNVNLSKLASDQMIFSDFYISRNMRDNFIELIKSDSISCQHSEYQNNDKSIKPQQLPKGRHKMSDFELGIITIKEEEYAALLDKLSPTSTYSGSNRDYEIARINTARGLCRVAITRSIQQGNAHAQSTATEIIGDIRPNFLLVVGIAGAIPSNDFCLGDVVVSNYIQDLTLEDTGSTHSDRRFNFLGGPLHPSATRIVETLRAIERKATAWNQENSIGIQRPIIQEFYTTNDADWNKEISKAIENHKKTSFPKATARKIASSDRLIKDPDLIRKWRSVLKDVSAVEMESAGVYVPCQRNDIPIFSIRGISDIIGLKRNEEWTLYACHSAAAYTKMLVQMGKFCSNY